MNISPLAVISLNLMNLTLEQAFEDNLSKCRHCKYHFNCEQRKPILICPMHHTVCEECLIAFSEKCPFCQHPIDLGRAVVNNYILYLLPDSTPNVRFQTNITFDSYSISKQQKDQQLFYNYNSLIQDESVSQPLPLIQARNNPHCLQIIQRKLQIQNDKSRKIIYFIIFIAQIPFLFLDFYLSSSQHSSCLDYRQNERFTDISTFLLVSGEVELAAFVILFVMVILTLSNLISVQTLKSWETTVLILWVTKIAIWFIIQIWLLIKILTLSCSNILLIYYIIQLAIYLIAFIYDRFRARQ